MAGALSLEVEDVQEMMRFNAYELTIDDRMLEDMASTAQVSARGRARSALCRIFGNWQIHSRWHPWTRRL